MFSPGGGIAFPGRGTKCWWMHHPSASKSSAGISPSRKAGQEQRAGARGSFATSVLSSLHRAVVQGLLPCPSCRAQLSPGSLLLWPWWGCKALCIMSGWCLSSPCLEPSVGASLCREVWEQSLLRGSWAKANSQLYQLIQKSSQLPPHCIVLGTCFQHRAWVCTSL